jgi:EPS-associated MarR family transcriptional regulator
MAADVERGLERSTSERCRSRASALQGQVQMLTDEVRYKLLKLLEPNPALSQREVARELGMSLGKVNYCLKALVEKGWIKAANFKNSRNKSAYMYLLTPRGIEAKARVTAEFLRCKLREHEQLTAEIDSIRHEVERLSQR